MEEDELESLRKKRLASLQQQMMSQEEMQEEQQQESDKQKKMILRAILADDARERLGRIKAARPELAENLENQLIMLAQQGRLKNKITAYPTHRNFPLIWQYLFPVMHFFNNYRAPDINKNFSIFRSYY